MATSRFPLYHLTMMRIFLCAMVAFAVLTGPASADRGTRAVNEWLQQCDSPRAEDRQVCVAMLRYLLNDQRRSRNEGNRDGYICPPADDGAFPLLRLVNQQVRARGSRYARRIADSEAPDGARMIGIALNALIDVFPCPGKG